MTKKFTFEADDTDDEDSGFPKIEPIVCEPTSAPLKLQGRRDPDDIDQGKLGQGVALSNKEEEVKFNQISSVTTAPLQFADSFHSQAKVQARHFPGKIANPEVAPIRPSQMVMKRKGS